MHIQVRASVNAQNKGKEILFRDNCMAVGTCPVWVFQKLLHSLISGERTIKWTLFAQTKNSLLL